MPSSSDGGRDRDAARRKAQNHFTASEQRDTMVRQEMEKERAAVVAKTAKLKALRLAKEAEDKVAADKLAVEKAAAKKEADAAKAAARRQARKTTPKVAAKV
jgi:hypothetical protein